MENHIQRKLSINCLLVYNTTYLKTTLWLLNVSIKVMREGEEQRRLSPSEFVLSYNLDVYTYIEHGSKNYTGGLKQLSVEKKTVPCPAFLESSQSTFWTNTSKSYQSMLRQMIFYLCFQRSVSPPMTKKHGMIIVLFENINCQHSHIQTFSGIRAKNLFAKHAAIFCSLNIHEVLIKGESIYYLT